MNIPKKIPCRERGQATIEFAFVMPLLVLILMGVFDLGGAVYAYNVMSSAAREGARYGIFKPYDSDGIRNQAKANTAALNPNLISVTSRCKLVADNSTAACVKPNVLEVVVTYQFRPFTLLFSPLTLTGKSEMMIEVPGN